jgi:hypothetical protein
MKANVVRNEKGLRPLQINKPRTNRRSRTAAATKH